MGTVGFLIVSSGIIAWVLANHVVHFLSQSWKGLLNGQGFDPASFILLNLVFSAGIRTPPALQRADYQLLTP